MDAEALLTTDPATLCATELSAHLIALDALRSRTEHAIRRAIGYWDADQMWADDGAANGAQWLGHRAGMSRAAARAEVLTARRLRSMPIVRSAADAGELCAAKVALFARQVHEGDEQLAKLFARDEQMLVDHAKNLTVDQTRYVLRRWRSCADDTAMRNDADRLYESRRASVSETFRGAWVIDAQLDPEGGAIFNNAVNQIMDELYDAYRASGNTAIYTATQRRADAFVEMARRAMAANPGEATPVRPLMVVTADIETLEGLANRPCELDDRGEITPEAARRLACDAGVARIIYGPDNAPIDLGRTARTPNRAQRRALIRRDGGCAFPGCDRPPAWCHAHHIQHWINGGRTDLDNLVLLCSYHHHLVHEGGFGLARAPDGQLQFTRPDGTELTPTNQGGSERGPTVGSAIGRSDKQWAHAS